MTANPSTLPQAGPGTPTHAPLSVLIVEDHDEFLDSLRMLIEREGDIVRPAASLAEARQVLSEKPVDVVLADLRLPDGNGLDLLTSPPEGSRADVVVITGNATVDSAVDALREGALDYLTKPLDRARLTSILTNVRRTRALQKQVDHLRDELREMGRFGRLVGRSSAMQVVYDLIARVAPTEATVFVTGESGTGKELVAETVHRLSPRQDGPYIAVNCGAIPRELIESELFGHEKGSFTGADRMRRGHFEEANAGILFLDEVTELPVEFQVKLLRVLETGEVTRVGSSSSIPVDVRVIAASNRDAAKAVKDGLLREDLFYRLNVFPIDLPPIRDRGEDVLLLADHFLDQVNRREGTVKRWSGASRERLRSHTWPGNVRELRNAVERAYILADEVLEPDLLPLAKEAPAEIGGGPVLRVRIGNSLAEVERRLLLATLQELGGDKRKAAEVLGISLKTIYNRLNVYSAAGTTGIEETSAD